MKALSLVLYIGYNASFIHSTINLDREDVSFADDHTAWVAGQSAEENILRIQNNINPKGL
jgi:hypothetical protein